MNQVLPDHFKELFSLLQAHQISLDSDVIQHYGRDWTRFQTPEGLAVVWPESVADVQQVVLWARRHRQPLVVSGGRTGLSGGALALKGQVIVSLERLNRILNFDPYERSLRVQAGVPTAQVIQWAQDHGLYYPIHFGAVGSSHIGGNIATNAGGIHVMRWGPTRSFVRDLTVVTGQGQVWQVGGNLVKDATGPQLMQLFIGSEGLFGIIVEAELQLILPPAPAQTWLLAFNDWETLWPFWQKAQGQVTFQAFEFFTGNCLKHVLSHSGLPNPFGNTYPLYVVCDVEMALPQSEETWMNLISEFFESGQLLDATSATSSQQKAQIWRLREGISESIASHTPYKNDISVPIRHVPSFLKEAEQFFQSHYPQFEVLWFGHIGDGNLHSNILKPPYLSAEEFFEKAQKADAELFTIVRRWGGSISAEHGVGLIKKKYLAYQKTPEELALLKTLKAFFDPDGILNPGKFFPDLV